MKVGGLVVAGAVLLMLALLWYEDEQHWKYIQLEQRDPYWKRLS